jgi:predicted peptidase
LAAPQLPGLNRWDCATCDEPSKYGQLAIELIAELQNTYPIDGDRIYLTGQSLGGWGVWDLVAKRPDLFAAAKYRLSGHAIWDRAYAEDGLIDWLFAQRKER